MEAVQQVHAAGEVGVVGVRNVRDLAERFFCYSWFFWAGIRDVHAAFDTIGVYRRALIAKRDGAVFCGLDAVTATIRQGFLFLFPEKCVKYC
ncbi:MAG TPA: hypothetical protein PLQ49_05370 [Methanothrix sp.]|nr:hypothetical protein [Methanothrix sp.]